MTSHHFEIVDGKAERLSVPFRYAWPAEYDLMAELAGMRLRERWAGWKREPFTARAARTYRSGRSRRRSHGPIAGFDLGDTGPQLVQADEDTLAFEEIQRDPKLPSPSSRSSFSDQDLPQLLM